jgi:hypothetical protein
MRGAGILLAPMQEGPAIFDSRASANQNRRPLLHRGKRDAGATGRSHSGTLSLHLRFREVADGLVYEARVLSPATSV